MTDDETTHQVDDEDETVEADPEVEAPASDTSGPAVKTDPIPDDAL
jgi:hypothetical protein